MAQTSLKSTTIAHNNLKTLSSAKAQLKFVYANLNSTSFRARAIFASRCSELSS